MGGDGKSLERLAPEQIESSLRWYMEFIGGLQVGIYRTSVGGRLLFLNQAFAEIFGFSSVDELLGRQVRGLYQEDGDRQVVVDTVLKSGHVEELLLPLRKKEGTPIWCAVNVKVVCDSDGRGLYLDGVIRDITDEMRLSGGETDPKGILSTKERLELQRRRVTEAKLKGILEMAGGAAHRLNQPLTIINNLLDEVMDDLNSDDRRRDRMIRMHRQIRKLNEIAKKIGRIKKYVPMDYVNGSTIVDIDKAS